jgi:hypothetical protein
LIVRNIIYGRRERNNTAETSNQQKDKKISDIYHLIFSNHTTFLH